MNNIPTLQGELWKPIVFPHPLQGYFISTLGRVYSIQPNRKGKFLKPRRKPKTPYLRVSIKGKDHTIHILVGRHFLPEYEEGLCILHKEETLPEPDLHFLQNLYVGTKKDNMWDTLRKRRNQVCCVLTYEQVVEIKQLLRENIYTDMYISKLYGVSSQNIGYIRKGKNWGWVK